MSLVIERFAAVRMASSGVPFATKRACSFILKVWMMVAVLLLECLDRHAKPACRLPEVDATLHRPGRGCVTKHVTHNFGPEACVGENA